MKLNRLNFLAALSAAGLVAWPLADAQTLATVARGSPSPSAVGPTRAEVLADLQIWRSSGMAAFEADTGLAHFGSRNYEAARTRYEQARSSAEFYALVQSIAVRTGERVPQKLAGRDVQAK